MSFRDLVHIKLKELEEPRFDPALSGVRVSCAEKIFPGFNLFDGQLMDARGQVLKKWKSRYLGLLLPDWRYVAQAHYGSDKWGMYTWDDEVIWEQDFPVHHDIVLTPRQTIITLTRETRPYKGRDVDFCVVVEFDLEGRELTRWSTWEHLAHLQKFHRPLELDRPRVFFLPEPERRKAGTPRHGHYDYYRLNSFQLLPRTLLGQEDRRFRQGNWLISFRHGSMLFILDQDTKKILWHAVDNQVKGRLEGPHAPMMLPNGHILIFDNGRYRQWSRLIEIDPRTLRIVWEYSLKNFYSCDQGYMQKLPNGNLLVTESLRGHVFEITPDKQVVWEYYYHEEVDTTDSVDEKEPGPWNSIYRMTRYAPDLIDPLLKK